MLLTSVVCQRASAQELRLGADFATLFDNKEYASMSFDSSGTLFSARLTPKVGFCWAERNELMFAVDMVQNFGHKSKFLSDVNVQIYYGYNAPRLTLYAGIFPRNKMKSLQTKNYFLQSPILFDRSYLYYQNRIGGVLARYENPSKGYVEFVMDYTGMRDFDTREAFTILSSGQHRLSATRLPDLSYGYELMMGHYAKDNNPATDDGVVDNLMLTPYLQYDRGFDLKRGSGLDLLVRLSYVVSLQRDRHFENRWESPMGGELLTAFGWQGLWLSNRLYMGRGSLLPFYDRYGSELYHGCAMYRTDRGIYDAISLSFKRAFFEDTVDVELGITGEYDGTGWGTRQWLMVSVDLDYGISLRRKQPTME